MKIVSGLAVIKCVSYTLGPEVFGQLGQLMTVVAITSMFAGGGISNGLIQRLAASSREEDRSAFISAAITIYLISSSLISILFILWSKSNLSFKLLGQQDLSTVILILALSQWLVGIYNIAQAIFSGYQRINLFIIVNIVGPLLGSCLFISLLSIFGFVGAAYGVVLLPACGGLIALLLLSQVKQINWSTIKPNLRSKEIKTLLSYSLVMLVAASSVPISQILVRDLLAESLGWTAVGYWFGVIKVSDVYMQFIGMLLANYAMPIFSSATGLDNLQAEIRKVLFPLAFMAALALLVFYILRNYIILAFFSSDFTQMEELFLPQFIGDYFRIIFSIFVYVFLARGNRVLPMMVELFQGIGLFVFSYALLTQFGTMAPVYAHVLVYAVMLLFITVAYFSLRQSWFVKDSYERIDAVY